MGPDRTGFARLAPVRVERRAHIGIVTFHRPDARNAIDVETARLFVAAVDSLEEDPEIRVVILTGDGYFSAGADLVTFGAGQVDQIGTPEGGFAGFVYRSRRKPYVAAIEGGAVGGGCEIALACDIVVAARSASFALPEVKLGLVAGAGGLARLVASVGTNRAMLMLLTGAPVSGERAYEFGLAAALCEDGEALDTALAIALQIAENSPSAVRLSREAVRVASGAEAASVVAAQDRARDSSWRSADGREGVRAFIEKRRPAWESDAVSETNGHR
jgi:enoyl-CoA hydratase